MTWINMRTGYTLLVGMLAALLLTGCTWFTKGLDVCQDDTCFEQLAAQRRERGDLKAAQQFCDAISDEVRRASCTENSKNK